MGDGSIKVLKFQKKKAGQIKYTFEEFAKAHIEACLNSNPLYSLSCNIEELPVLTFWYVRFFSLAELEEVSSPQKRLNFTPIVGVKLKRLIKNLQENLKKITSKWFKGK